LKLKSGPNRLKDLKQKFEGSILKYISFYQYIYKNTLNKSILWRSRFEPQK